MHTNLNIQNHYEVIKKSLLSSLIYLSRESFCIKKCTKMQWTNQKKNKKSHPNLLCAVEGSSPGVDADALLPPTLWRAHTRTERRASAGRFTGDTACGHYGRRRCSRLDGHVGVDAVTAVDHGGVDDSRVS